ncbi:helix-turn-helix domain-containing protein [Paractinoplanes ferrugineus]|uniref:HxlR family transcriptional regulator n=1 Tax=Paractinoplanes ferrugineus TaxID=113564 RepID=A0A919IYX7_9ACTN|nr:helix-turn-helix domain-containing protein [Actinoplanes ferrugineus]GIE10452.1 HxlR family transcriptional regulator [Actinoplanes ferrugineus]
MLGKLYETQVCSAARTLEIVGERWSLLIVRNAMFAGMTRFTEFQRSLGIAPNILTKRLTEFVEAGLFEQRPGPVYALTAKGRELQPIILALTAWGDRWAAPDGPPVTYEHAGCGGEVVVEAACERCGERPPPPGVTAQVAGWARRRQDARPVS